MLSWRRVSALAEPSVTRGEGTVLGKEAASHQSVRPQPPARSRSLPSRWGREGSGVRLGRGGRVPGGALLEGWASGGSCFLPWGAGRRDPQQVTALQAAPGLPVPSCPVRMENSRQRRRPGGGGRAFLGVSGIGEGSAHWALETGPQPVRSELRDAYPLDPPQLGPRQGRGQS